MDNLSSFLTVVAAVSVAVERIVEILKTSLSSVPGFHWIFNAKPGGSAIAESIRCAVLHCLAGIIGTVIAMATKIDAWHKLDIFQVANQQPHWYYWWGSYVLTGLLSSGGSAMWNHSLDILSATKVQKEQAAKAITASNLAQTAIANTAVGAAAAELPNPNAVVL